MRKVSLQQIVNYAIRTNAGLKRMMVRTLKGRCLIDEATHFSVVYISMFYMYSFDKDEELIHDILDVLVSYICGISQRMQFVIRVVISSHDII